MKDKLPCFLLTSKLSIKMSCLGRYKAVLATWKGAVGKSLHGACQGRLNREDEFESLRMSSELLDQTSPDTGHESEFSALQINDFLPVLHFLGFGDLSLCHHKVNYMNHIF